MNNKLKENILLGTYLIILYFILLNIKYVINIFGSILGILSPFIIAFAMAFVLNLPMKLFEKNVFNFLDNQKSTFIKNLKRSLSILATFVTVISLIIALVLFVVPELISSISTLLYAIPDYAKSFEGLINNFISSTELIQNLYDTFITTWREILQFVGGLLTTSLTGILSTTLNLTNHLVNFIFSIVLTIYMLASKETLIYHCKKLLYAFIKKPFADKIIKLANLSNITFAKFIAGQCIEAAILGVLCFIGMNIFSMPYALLISVLIATTALIPVLGAFIGAIPAVLLILLINPIKAFWFIIFILFLQQFEGNIIYPRVVGNSIGLPAIWVMMAMIVGGSALGLVGMLIGIPIFSIIYQLVKHYTNKRLKSNGIKI